VVGISIKPALVSGQELGVRLTRPADWARDYLVPFDRYRALDRVRTVQARLTRVDLAARVVYGDRPDGTEIAEPYDALVISTGVTNGFWRRSILQSSAEIRAEITADHDRLAAAASVMVVGGGAAEGSTTATFTPSGGGLSMGSGPKRQKTRMHNQRVLEALVKLTGANFEWNIAAWRTWLANRQSPPDFDPRRG
jgi:hypothetical protein